MFMYAVPIVYHAYAKHQGLVYSKEKRACNLVLIKIQTEAKNSNILCISYGTKAAKLLKIVQF